MYILKVVCTSDTHGLHRGLDIPDGDIFLYAGDFSMLGELKVLADFNEWLGQLPHKHKIMIAGNHDRCFENKNKDVARKILTNVTYLENSGCEVDGINIWGSPITSTLSFWAFAYTREVDRFPIWDKMPENLDILLTHTPPKNILDFTTSCEHVGDGLLNSYIAKNKPKYNIFGHIHESYGYKEGSFTKFYNVSAVNEVYLLQNPPVVINI